MWFYDVTTLYFDSQKEKEGEFTDKKGYFKRWANSTKHKVGYKGLWVDQIGVILIQVYEFLLKG